MQNDRESRKLLNDLFKNIKTDVRILAWLELICAVAGSDCDCK